MTFAGALDLPEIQGEICRISPRGTLYHVAQVNTSWGAAATASLWSSLPGLLPLLSLMPYSSINWSAYASLNASGGLQKNLSLDIQLTTDQVEKVLRRSRIVNQIHFGGGYEDRATNLSIAIAVQAMFPTDELFPMLKTVTMRACTQKLWVTMPQIPYAVAGVTIAQGRRNADEIRGLAATFPQAPSLAINCRLDCPRSYMAAIVHGITALHVHGQDLGVVLAVIGSRPAWSIKELRIDVPVAAPGQLDHLFCLLTQHCLSTIRLAITIHALVEDQRWSLTSAVLQALSTLWLTSLYLHLPMRASMSDDDLIAAAESWPGIQELRVIDISPLPPPRPATSMCTLHGLAAVISRCPHLEEIALPGLLDCRSVPTALETRMILRSSLPSSGFPLALLEVEDCLVHDVEAAGSFLRGLFPYLLCIGCWEDGSSETLDQLSQYLLDYPALE
ncbi:hypothetical protein BD626DRAFT_539212 [Schizophyllum amplum]|uniref:F-box domain-containing protein n=1 Tax=Schizophyllum amplum TaxID=97359 RepID=A0A550C4I0_9AGAR|nr:hypothetical protein BD626DRAFT_572382 [Auriculariopsis ampla]TRM59757.1 hypothetical protein BD626DRAFT_539212 [Auriculariopsis ampla]